LQCIHCGIRCQVWNIFLVQCIAMKNVAEYVIICMSCSSELFDCDGFCCYRILLNIPNLSIIVKTGDPVQVREREREQIKEFIYKPAYLLKSMVEPKSS
jgi:hypothetical protein